VNNLKFSTQVIGPHNHQNGTQKNNFQDSQGFHDEDRLTESRTFSGISISHLVDFQYSTPISLPFIIT
jgi:hypothetical protein